MSTLEQTLDYGRILFPTKIDYESQRRLELINTYLLTHPLIIYGNHPSFDDVRLVNKVLPLLPNLESIVIPMAVKHYQKFNKAIDWVNSKEKAIFAPVSQKPKEAQTPEEREMTQRFFEIVQQHMIKGRAVGITPGGRRDFGRMREFRTGLPHIVCAHPYAIVLAGAIQYHGMTGSLKIAEPIPGYDLLQNVKADPQDPNYLDQVNNVLAHRVAEMLPPEMRGVYGHDLE